MTGETGPAFATALNDPGTDLLFLPNGKFLTAKGLSNRVRRMDPQGNMSAFAGNGFLDIGGQDNIPAVQSSIAATAVVSGANGGTGVGNVEVFAR